ncbi:MAG TPA: hypothetical protein VIK55_04855 [Paludibacter sp.]
MNAKIIQQMYNKIKLTSINVRRQIPFSKVGNNSNQFLDFMLENFEIGHSGVIDFMGNEKTKQLIAKVVPSKGTGYVQIFVKEENSAFQTYGIRFIPYRIIHKFWGLGFKNVNIKDFIFFECLCENDETKFRGCLLK